MIESIDELKQFTEDYQYWLIAGYVVALVLVFGSVHAAARFKTHLHGNAGFADSSEVAASGLYSKNGIVLGQFKGRVLRLGGSLHCALAAPTRSGKGVSVVTPTMFAFHESVVANDDKDELYYQTSKYRERCGQRVWKYAPYSRTTHRQNPLDYVSDDPMQRVSSIQSIAYILYPASHSGESSMWRDNARALFVSMVLLVKESDDMPSTIGEIYRISGGYGMSVPDYLQKIIWKRNYDRVEHLNDKGEVESIEYVKKPPYDGTGVPHLSNTCVDGLMKYITAPKDTGGGILSNLQAALQIWASEIVDAATSCSDFDLRTFRQEKQTLYVHIPDEVKDQGGVLITLLYSQLIKMNMNELTGDRYPYQVLLALDEFGSLKIPIVEQTIGKMAGFGLRCLLIFQSKGQIQKSTFEGGYGIAGAKNLLDNCACIGYFTPKKEDSEEISQLLGDRTVKAKSVQIGNRWKGSVSDQRRELMKPQELRQLSQKLCIIDVDGCRPIKAKKLQWYSDERFRSLLWATSAKLRGVKKPTERQIQAARDELCSHVPTLDDKQWLAAKATREQRLSLAVAETKTVVAAATHKDVAKGLILDDLIVGDLEFDEGTSTQEQIDGYLDAFFADESIDYETGEVTPNTVNITGELDAA